MIPVLILVLILIKSANTNSLKDKNYKRMANSTKPLKMEIDSSKCETTYTSVQSIKSMILGGSVLQRDQYFINRRFRILFHNIDVIVQNAVALAKSLKGGNGGLDAKQQSDQKEQIFKNTLGILGAHTDEENLTFNKENDFFTGDEKTKPKHKRFFKTNPVIPKLSGTNSKDGDGDGDGNIVVKSESESQSQGKGKMAKFAEKTMQQKYQRILADNFTKAIPDVRLSPIDGPVYCEGHQVVPAVAMDIKIDGQDDDEKEKTLKRKMPLCYINPSYKSELITNGILFLENTTLGTVFRTSMVVNTSCRGVASFCGGFLLLAETNDPELEKVPQHFRRQDYGDGFYPLYFITFDRDDPDRPDHFTDEFMAGLKNVTEHKQKIQYLLMVTQRQHCCVVVCKRGEYRYMLVDRIDNYTSLMKKKAEAWLCEHLAWKWNKTGSTRQERDACLSKNAHDLKLWMYQTHQVQLNDREASDILIRDQGPL